MYDVCVSPMPSFGVGNSLEGSEARVHGPKNMDKLCVQSFVIFFILVVRTKERERERRESERKRAREKNNSVEFLVVVASRWMANRLCAALLSTHAYNEAG